MNPTILGIIGPGFLNQVLTLWKSRADPLEQYCGPVSAATSLRLAAADIGTGCAFRASGL